MEFMIENNYLSSLKDKEFLILEKLCSNSISSETKKELEEELAEIRSEIEKINP